MCRLLMNNRVREQSCMHTHPPLYLVHIANAGLDVLLPSELTQLLVARIQKGVEDLGSHWHESITPASPGPSPPKGIRMRSGACGGHYLTGMFKKPLWDDLSFLTWSCRKEPSEDVCAHKRMDVVSNNANAQLVLRHPSHHYANSCLNCCHNTGKIQRSYSCPTIWLLLQKSGLIRPGDVFFRESM